MATGPLTLGPKTPLVDSWGDQLEAAGIVVQQRLLTMRNSTIRFGVVQALRQKLRVVHQPVAERNYHIYCQLLGTARALKRG